jgi:hypothetical protein
MQRLPAGHARATFVGQALRLLSALCLGLVGLSSAHAQALPKVAIYAADYSYSVPAVQAQLLSTGLFSAVDNLSPLCCGTDVTPTLAVLTQYSAVMVWNNFNYNSNVALGNVLADYVDAGGRVVVATFSMYSLSLQPGFGLSGRIASGGYMPFSYGSNAAGVPRYLVPVISHPLLAGVGYFDGGLATYRHTGLALAPGATLVANWSDNVPLLAFKGDVVALNVWPLPKQPSSFYNNWDPAATDGERLLANTLLARTLPDADDDGVVDNSDNCPSVSNANQTDSDADFIGDACDSCPADNGNDADQDGVCGNVDNCPTVPNASQQNSDGRGAGDACLEGIDNDGDLWENEVDNCPSVANTDQSDSDLDLAGDVCETCPLDQFNDADGDGRCANLDNCPEIPNFDQLDSDADLLGDACDTDNDNDGRPNANDNCPLAANPAQSDFDNDGQGDACDTDRDGDAVVDSGDRCQLTPPDSVVDAEGCAIAQLCPCDGTWRTHGQFTSCTAKAADRFLAGGLISQQTKDAIMSAAGKADCGKK